MNESEEAGQSPVPPPLHETVGQPEHPHPTWTAESGPPPEEKKSRLWLWIVLGVVLALVVALVVAGVVMWRNDTTDVPDLRGQSLSQAVQALTDVGLQLGEVGYTSELPADIEEGQTVGQNPAAGERVDRGTAVDVVVAGEAKVKVPDVRGLTVEEATRTLETAGFKVKGVEAENAAEKGTVVDQSPQAGTAATPGSEVTVIVSAGVVQTLVPKVVGMSQDDATATLQKAGYQVQSKGTYDEKVAEGIVISQSPQAGVAADQGTRVDIFVSQGKNPEAGVPDVVGQTEADAADALASAGFEAVPSSAYSETVAVGTVIGQDPAGGVTAQRGSSVTITVSQGPKPPDTTVVPKVVGMTEAEATDILKGAGYQVAVARYYSDAVPRDVVGAQAPIGGNVTQPGITVGIIVSDGPRPVDEFVIVPDLRGMGLDEATAALQEAGLIVDSAEVFTELAPKGQVFAQLPPPDSSVAPGSTVLLLVSKGPYAQVNPL